jgi:integrase
MGKAAKGKRIEKFDAGAPGLCLRITDKGAKSWSVYYRLNGKHQRMTIGTWGKEAPGVGVAEARDRAREIKEQAKGGVDPKGVRAAITAATQTEAGKTFTVVAENYIKRECSKLKRGKEYEAAIRRELLPPWGAHLMTDLRRLHLSELTDVLLDAGKPGAANRVHEIAKRIFNWAVERGEIEASPFATMKAPVSKVMRERVLKPHEIEAVWKAWDVMGYPLGPLGKLLLVTAQRLREVAMMQWVEMDRDNAMWVIPADRTKSGRETEVPLSSLALDILDGLPRFAQRDHVFTTTSGERPVSGFSKMKARTDSFSGVTDWRLHDLRRTARTGLAELGVPEIIAEKVLNHSPRNILTTIYNRHEYADEKRDALERWALRLREITEPAPENVVRMKAQG